MGLLKITPAGLEWIEALLAREPELRVRLDMTALMKSVAGIVHPKSGSITFEGEDITSTPAHRMIYKGISYVPEGRRFFANLTVRENLELGAFPVSDRKIIDERLEEIFSLFPILKERGNQLAQTMSGGEQQMCAIARGLMSAPKLLMLDELFCLYPEYLF